MIIEVGLRAPLEGVLGWAFDPSGGVLGTAIMLNPNHAAWGLIPAFPRVAGRVREMLEALDRDGFVSFG